MGLSPNLLKGIEALGYEKPTPIQEKIIPLVLETEKDIIGLAQTGTGKTAAFGLPVIEQIDFKNKTVQALVLAPTRELCIQISKDLQNLSKNVERIQIVPVYGGTNIDAQIRALKKGTHIIVATPGRMLDLIKRRAANIANIRTVILDEADEMLNMGFRDELDGILEKTPAIKRTLLFSATMPKEVARIAENYMNNPDEITVGKQNSGADNVKHVYYQVQSRDRYLALKRIADINPNIYGIVFCRTRRETKEIANKLMQDGYNADAIHGDLTQSQRDEVMRKFRVRQLQILVATDVAARGLDVTDLSHIINYNLPDDDEIYTHRSGRTGRAGKKGISIAIIHTRETRKLREIEKKSGIKFSKELVPSGKDICTKQLYTLIDKIEKVEVDENQIEPFLPAVYKKLDWLSREELIKHFVSAEFNRFLSYYKNAKDLNISEKENPDKKGKSKRSRASFLRLYINVGSKNNLNPARLIGLINEALDSGNAEIGKIEILRKFSFFEIDNQVVEPLITALNTKDFEGVQLMVEVSKEKPAGNSFSKSNSAKQRNSGNRKDKRKKTYQKNKGNRGQRDHKKW